MYIITGSTGLIGYSTSEYFLKKGIKIIGIDNDLRSYFFGKMGSNYWKAKKLKQNKHYNHQNIDIRNKKKILNIFKKYSKKIKAIIHTAAQPSHDWAAREPFTDFDVNANGTLNLLEGFRKYCPEATFVFTSTNKVYGDTPNFLPLVEQKYRYEINNNHKYFKFGIDEKMSLDHTTHSLFGVSKTSADLLVQEYGRYFKLKTVCFRGGCLTGENHTGAQLHGFLSYLVKTIFEEKKYFVYGYKGKQVRDNIDSSDVASFTELYINSPKSAEVYNIGGGKENSISILEVINYLQENNKKKMKWNYVDENRLGDHICYYTDLAKIKSHYPGWGLNKSLNTIIDNIYHSWSNKKKFD